VCFALKGVDHEKYTRFQEDAAEPSEEDVAWAKEHLAAEESEADPLPGAHHLYAFIRKAWEAGEFRYIRKVEGCAITPTLKAPKDGISFGRTGTRGPIDFSDAEKVSLMEREHRKQVYEYARFLRKYVPGFENSYLLHTAAYMGARGGRYIDSVQHVEGENIQAGDRFDDVIYPYHCGRAGNEGDIPYRMLLPKTIDGLLGAGRSAMIYGPNFRVRYSVMLCGQAAGIAAALCAADGVAPRELDVKKLQRILVDLGSPVAPDERLRELGII